MKVTKALYDLLYALPIALFTCLLCYPGTPGILFYGVVVAFTTLIVFFAHMDTKGKSITAALLVAIPLGIFLAVGEEERKLFMNDYKWVLWSLGLCILSLFAAVLVNNVKTAKYILMAGCVLFFALVLVLKYEVSKICVAAVFFTMLMILVEIIQIFWVKENNTEKSRHAVNAAPFILIVIVAAFLFKMPDEPYDWKVAKDIAEFVKRSCENIGNTIFPGTGWDGDDAVIGFSERGSLAASVRSDTYLVLEIGAYSAVDQRMYFSGKTFDTFDGQGWVKTDDSTANYGELDSLATVSAVLDYDPNNTPDYLKRVMAKVSYEGLKTSCIFVPQKTVFTETSFPTVFNGGDVNYGKRRKEDYRVDFYQLNRGYEGFEDMICNADKINPEAWEEARTLPGYTATADNSYEAYEKHVEHIKEVYTDDYVLSDEMQQYMEDIIGDETNDVKKLEKIQQALRKLEYNTTPGAIPEEVDSPEEFLDYFVLDSKKGFCAHYATAFVLMARSEGIPARYVQGYSKTVTESRKLTIMSDDAHAWPEAYVEGVGWLAFEPTPGYESEIGWEVKDSVGQAEEYNPYERYMQNPLELPENKENPEDMEEKKEINILVILIPTLLGILFISLFLFVEKLVQRRHYGQMDDSKKVMQLCRKILKLMERNIRKLKDGETLEEYILSIKDTVPEETVGLLERYEFASYSKTETNWKDVAKAEEEYAASEKFVFDRRIERIKSFFVKSHRA